MDFLLERNDQVEVVEAVRAEIVDEARFRLNFGRVDIEMLDHDFLHAFSKIRHSKGSFWKLRRPHGTGRAGSVDVAGLRTPVERRFGFRGRLRQIAECCNAKQSRPKGSARNRESQSAPARSEEH